MKDNSFDIAVDANDKHFEGWATPSESIKEDGSPKSFHVVLNGAMFGNISFDGNAWSVDEERPEALTEAVGKFIEDNYKNHA